jgi:hypothetical protein
MFFLLNVDGVSEVARDVAVVEVGKHVHNAHTVRLIVADDAVLEVDTAQLAVSKGVLVSWGFLRGKVVEDARRDHLRDSTCVEFSKGTSQFFRILEKFMVVRVLIRGENNSTVLVESQFAFLQNYGALPKIIYNYSRPIVVSEFTLHYLEYQRVPIQEWFNVFGYMLLVF